MTKAAVESMPPFVDLLVRSVQACGRVDCCLLADIKNIVCPVGLQLLNSEWKSIISVAEEDS
jgi:hypothetical protein